VKDNRVIHCDLKNPFEDAGENYIRHVPSNMMPSNSLVNGYVKFQFTTLVPGGKVSCRSILSPPPNFGFCSRLNDVDRKLWTFCKLFFLMVPRRRFAEPQITDISAWCAGRTIIDKSNSWASDLARMFDASASLRHAILALSAIYILDYKPKDDLRRLANKHYRAAVTLLSRDMENPLSQRIGKGDDIIAAIACLNMIDVFQPIPWQLDFRHDHLPLIL
jgi:Fungal specific transcription factor domain